MELDEKIEEKRFDAFCRKVIINEAKDGYREKARKRKREVSLTNMTPRLECECYTEDVYKTYERIYYVGDIPVAVHDEILGDVLQYVVPARRNVILLSFILGMKDREIASALDITYSTVGRRRRAALEKIRELMEARENGRHED